MSIFIKIRDEEQKWIDNKKGSISERRQTLIKECKARGRMYSSLTELIVDAKKKLEETGILNKDKWNETINAGKAKFTKIKKILIKPLGIGLLTGAAIGSLVGLGINHLFKNRKNAESPQS